MSTRSGNKEKSCISFIVSHHSDDGDKVNNFDLSDKPSYDELQDFFNDLHDKCLKLSRICAK